MSDFDPSKAYARRLAKDLRTSQAFHREFSPHATGGTGFDASLTDINGGFPYADALVGLEDWSAKMTDKHALNGGKFLVRPYMATTFQP